RRLAREAGFSRVFVQSAAGDAGGALGAAIDGAISLGDPRPTFRVDLGQAPDVGAAAAIAGHLGLRVARVDPAVAAAERIADGAVVGWVQGRFEWGPRALGHRSLLAEPTRAATR